MSISAGTTYWFALLAPRRAGTIKFRDLPDGRGEPTQTIAQRTLTSATGLPKIWKAGVNFANSPASVYATP